MKKGIFKKVFALFLALTMMVTMVPTAYASTGETTEAIEQVDEIEDETTESVIKEITEPVVEDVTEVVEETTEIIEEITEVIVEEVAAVSVEDENQIAVTSADITPPVVESLTSDINGKIITYGESVSFTMYAYDAESELSAEKSRVGLLSTDGRNGYQVVPTFTKGTNENEYILTFTPLCTGEWFICDINIADESGNGVYNYFYEENGVYPYAFVVESAINNEVEIINLEINSNVIELTDTVMTNSVDVTLQASGIDENAIVEVKYVTDDTEVNIYANELNGTLYYEDGVYKGSIIGEYYNVSGCYYFEGIYVNNQKINYVEKSQIHLVKNNTDKVAPIVSELKVFNENGEEIENGETCFNTNKITIRVKVEDASAIQAVFVSLSAVLDTVADSDRHKSIVCEYDAETGYYIGMVDLADYYPTTWMINNVQVVDIYENRGYVDFYNTNPYCFNVKSADGSCTIPTKTLEAYFAWNLNERYSITIGAVSSLKEMFPEGIPQAPSYEGCEFLGWKISNDEKVYTENDRINTSIYFDTYSLTITPVYDKVPADVRITYMNSNNQLVEDTFVLPVEKGTTLSEFYTDFKAGKYDYNLDGLKHCTEIAFEGWKCQNLESDREIGFMEQLYMTATYDHLYAKCFLEYYDENGKQYRDTNGSYVFFKEGTTYEEFIKSFHVEDIIHYDKIQFQGWKYHDSYSSFFGYEGEMSSIAIILQAVYDKSVVDVQFNYYDENDEIITTDACAVLFEEGKTYDEILSMTDVSNIAHTTNLGEFTGWKVYNNGVLLDSNALITSGSLTYVANYEKSGLWIGHSYYDENNNETTVGEVVALESDMTEDVLKEQYQIVLDNVKHSEEMNFAKWDWQSNNFAQVPSIICNAIYHNLKITFDPNGGTNLSESYRILESEWKGYGHIPNEVIGDLPTVERDGYEFLGWFNMPEGGTLYTSDSIVWGHATLYAQWKSLSKPEVPAPDVPEEPDIEDEPVVEETPSEEVPPVVIVPTIPSTEQNNDRDNRHDNDRDEDDRDNHRENDRDDIEREQPVKPAVKLEEEKITEVVDKIHQVNEGETVVIDMKKEDGNMATEVPVEVLEAVKGKDIKVELDMGDYKWTIHGKDVQDVDLKAINLEVTFDTAAVEDKKVNEKADGDFCRQISLTHNGEFGFKASLTINVGREHEGRHGNLYYHNKEGKLEFMNSGIIDKDGNVSLDFNHASDYVIVVGRDRTEEEAVAAENAQADVQDNAADTIGVVEDAESENGFPVGIVILVVVVVSIGAVVVMKKKK